YLHWLQRCVPHRHRHACPTRRSSALATETNDGVPNMVLTTTTQTRGALKRLNPFEARSESIFELPSGRLMLLTEASESGKKKTRSEEHTSELQSRENLVCRRLLEKHE